jgi:PKD repeat protein
MDEPAVTIADVTPDNASDLTMFEATLTSNIAGTTGVTYRWDFGDGTAYSAAYESNQASHTYAVCGNYTVRVEAVDSWGNKAIGTFQVQNAECVAHVRYLPLAYSQP